MSEAGGLVARLAEAGVDPQLLSDVAQALFTAEAKAEILDARRKKDRERKSSRSEEIHGNPRPSEESLETPSPLDPPKVSPAPLPNPPLSPNPDDLSARPTPKPLSKKEVIEAWQTRMVPLGFPAIAKMTGQRERQLNARLKDSTIEEWQRAMDALERSAFCRGENDRGWRADFDFLLQPKSFTKLLEGAYDH